MKAVLVSLKPYYYYLVGEGIKKIEVRKGMPKAEDWNRDTFFYMSKDEKSFAKIPKEFQEKYRKHFGKVGLRFVCDRIDEFLVFENGTVQYWNCHDLEKSCLTYSKIANYIGNNKKGYAWHISDLIVYDKPKELSDFYAMCNIPESRCKLCDNCYDREDYYGMHYAVKKITRPPQSWQYVEV